MFYLHTIMKDISIYFQAVDLELTFQQESLGDFLKIHTTNSFPEMNKKGIAIIEVPEYRNDSKHNEIKLSNNFRQYLYQLFIGHNWEMEVYDLGTILPGESINDTYHALQASLQELIKKEITPIIIGGSQDLTKTIYNAYEKLEMLVNLTTIDNQLDLGDVTNVLKSNAWLSHVLLHKPCFLFNYSNIGAQRHYISNKTIDLFNSMYFDICRLGEVNDSIHNTEPYLRNTDIVSMDLTSIRASDLQNKHYTAPNGLFAHDACRIMRYAGISDKLSSLGIFNYYSENNHTTDELVAQLIWYFIEGYANRKGDFPIGSKKSYTKFTVFLEELNEEIIFYKSDKSGRWWMEVPYPGSQGSKYIRHQMVPCSYEIYEEAMQGEIPNLWWKTYQKFA